MSKRCCVCQVEKPFEDFNRRAASPSGYQGKCRQCSKAASKKHYEESPKYYQQKARNRKLDIKAEVSILKQGKPCVDCGGVFHPVAMDFDHRDPKGKVGGIATLASRSWSLDRILDEVAKCDLVCANCHRVRTYLRSEVGVGYEKSGKRYR